MVDVRVGDTVMHESIGWVRVLDIKPDGVYCRVLPEHGEPPPRHPHLRVNADAFYSRLADPQPTQAPTQEVGRG